ncbi:hypothetical protein AKJ65_08175 [candidate division MSBL1 archaeon SCGC-AAA259E19]|uniref:PIN domain-containing protein n=1 Tax=candidate division MSBL1 archaeon SCGC-AAA259E19 TaxID=1698264 RepID=A0A133UCX4_9EURY|nr:hypothetical protein AKJ65_08175 [candidate division MSBL1 archaeon SCGC-AAA259E19]
MFSPLIHLSRAGRIGLLEELFDEVLVPPCVERETIDEAKELGKPGTRAIKRGREKGWIEIEEVRDEDEIEKMAESENIEPEDAEVLQLAKETSSKLITNDSWLVKVAKANGVETLWTTTLVLLAVERGKIGKEEGRKLLKELARSGLYLKSDVYGDLLDAIEKL